MWKIPQGRAVDGVRWLPASPASWDPTSLVAFFDPDTGISSVELTALRFPDMMAEPEEAEPEDKPRLDLLAHWSHPDRVSSIATASFGGHRSVFATGSRQGYVRVALADPLQCSDSPPLPQDFLISPRLHCGNVAGVDVQSESGDCLSVGEDGRLNLVKVAQSEIRPQEVYHGGGWLSFSAVKWASPMECLTAGVGAPLQWWDLRRPGGPASQCRLKWDGSKPGFAHSIDVHPSRKHLCVVGGSAGTVFAWDLRWKQEATKLIGDASKPSIIESDIWQVKYDHYMPADSGKFPPVMICSEDGVLALVDGENVTELLVEPCAINTFDIDPENGKDIVCGLEYESLAFLRRKNR